MALTLDSYKTIRFSSKHNITAYEYRSANMHRAIFEIAGNGEEFSRNDFDSFRKEIALNLKRSFLSPFAFGIVFDDAAVSPELATEWIDNTDRRGGPCQWIIVKQPRFGQATGVHMWQEGKTTGIFESILDGLFARGLSVVALVKKPRGFMKLAPYFGIRVYKLSRYRPEPVGGADG